MEIVGGGEGRRGTGLIAVSNRVTEVIEPGSSKRYQGKKGTTFRLTVVRVIQQYNRLPREAVISPFFELFKTQLNKTLSKLVQFSCQHCFEQGETTAF